MRIGDVSVSGISDGAFVVRASYFGGAAGPTDRPDFFSRDRAAWLPIGCFLVRAPDRLVLVDAGLGPEAQSLPDGMLLVGGQLPTGLRTAGATPAAITDVVCTHLHVDHVGWLFDQRGERVFPAADLWLGAGDWDHFVEGDGEIAEHIRSGFRRLVGTAALHRLEDDHTLTAGLTVRLSPGHTPGSLYVEVASRGRRLLLIGDAITAPIQLDEPDWHSFGDVDPVLAARSRARLWDELSQPGTSGVGAHFPELQPGHVVRDADSAGWVGEEGDSAWRGEYPVTPSSPAG